MKVRRYGCWVFGGLGFRGVLGFAGLLVPDFAVVYKGLVAGVSGRACASFGLTVWALALPKQGHGVSMWGLIKIMGPFWGLYYSIFLIVQGTERGFGPRLKGQV